MKKDNLIIILLGIVVLFIVGVTFFFLESVLLPFIVAVLLSIIFRPAVVYLNSKKIPMAISLFIVVLVCALMLSAVSFLIYNSVESFTNEFPKYESKFNQKTAGWGETLTNMTVSMGINPEDLTVSKLLPFSTISQYISNFAGVFINLAGNVVMVLLFMLFLLAGTGDSSTKIYRAFTKEHADRISHIVNNITKSVRTYLIKKTLISILTGTLYALITWLFGIDFPVFWGFLAFILNFIPNVGSLIATVFPVIFSLFQFDSLVSSVIMLILLIIAQNIVGNGIEPIVFAESLDLSPVLILIALIFWGWLWGIVGMLLAVPLTATIKIICENISQLKPIAVLMGGNRNGQSLVEKVKKKKKD
ncbi:MAG: AI-2E family transporter [Ignavibacteriae bacterium]|nr:AI-2E family transporter [Ignavibacteriota bacterium]